MTADGPSDIEDVLKCWVKSPPCCWGTWWKSLPEIYHLWSDAQSVFTVKLHQQSKYLISTWNFPYKVSAWVLEGRCGNLNATFEQCNSCRRAFNIQLYLNFIYLSIYFLTYFIYYFVTSHTSYILLTWCHSSLRNVWDCQGTQQTPSGRATGSKCSGDSFPILDLCLSDDKPSSDPAEVPLIKTMRKWHHPISTHLAECPCWCTHSSCEKYICIEFLNHLMVMMMLIIHPFIHPFSLLFLLHSGSWGILEPVLSSCCLWPQTGLHPGQFASFVEGPLKKTKKHF